jgi:hypothetical protein
LKSYEITHPRNDTPTKTGVFNASVFLDTGSGSGASLPTEVWKDIYGKFDPKTNPSKDQTIHCKHVKSLPTIILHTVEGGQIEVTYKHQVLIAPNCTCILVFEQGPPTGSLLWGANFLAMYFTVFDFHKKQMVLYDTKQKDHPDKCF